MAEVQSENSIFRGIAEQTKIALKQAPIEIIKLFKQIPKAKLNIKGIEDCSVSILRYSEESMVIKLTSNKEQIFHYILMEEIEFISI